ncbi:WXG100 family type VII secretion target [Mycobacterium shimoidei]|uniref:WXG100 family type VII secretion target n=1 Tax=Mycobacterium shimoidei TaxID=29313 RepID=UPI0021F25BC2|nr:WXG100 family type VII secretion target [Mycobacterium shimoidei]MCV7259520.1 WXG100 family type VII secretion target [Mycobacterium shimoidei]
MPEPLKVDPIDLHISADQMSIHHAELRAAHTEANSDIEGAQAGWVGVSAVALQAKLAEWLATTEQLCGSIADHEQAFRAAVQQYETVDADGAEKITHELG